MSNLSGHEQGEARRQREAARYRDLASMYKRQGQNFKSIEYYEKSLQIYHAIGDRKEEEESATVLALSMLKSAKVRK